MRHFLIWIFLLALAALTVLNSYALMQVMDRQSAYMKLQGGFNNQVVKALKMLEGGEKK